MATRGPQTVDESGANLLVVGSGVQYIRVYENGGLATDDYDIEIPPGGAKIRKGAGSSTFIPARLGTSFVAGAAFAKVYRATPGTLDMVWEEW